MINSVFINNSLISFTTKQIQSISDVVHGNYFNKQQRLMRNQGILMAQLLEHRAANL